MYKKKFNYRRFIAYIILILFIISISNCEEQVGLSTNGPLSFNQVATLEEKEQKAGTFEYTDILIPKQVEFSQSPNWTNPSNFVEIQYSATPTLPEGVSLDSSTGEIKVSATSKPNPTKEYTITAKNVGAAQGEVATQVKITINDATIIDGTLTYPPTTVNIGIAKTISPTWTGASDAGQKVGYSISPTKAGISIESSTGVITVGNDVSDIDGTYTITAVGTGKYGGTVKGTASITLSNDLPDFTYPITVMTEGTATTIKPSPVLPSGLATYTLKSGAFPTGISIDATSGTISIGANASPLAATTYTIVASSTKSNSTKEAGAKITIESNVIDMNTYTLTYANTTTTRGVAKTITPATTIPANIATYTLARQGGGVPTGISIDADSGVVSIGTTAVVMGATTFTVTATPKSSGYSNTKTATFTITITPKDISGYQLIYGDTTATYGNSATVAKNTTIPSAAVARYTVNPALPTGITLSNTTGEITIGTNAAVQSQTTYTVTATATDAQYTGTVTATVKITVEQILITGNTFSYGDLATDYGVAAQRTPNENFPAAAVMRYTVEGTPTLPTGISINATTGVISVGATALVQTETTYTVRATATGANYQGTKDATIKITVRRVSVTGNTFSYGDIIANIGIEKKATPNQNFPAGAKMRYAVVGPPTLPTGISINASTGEITVGTNAGLHPEDEYTVRATATDANYAGSKDAKVKITVEKISIAGSTFSYVDINTEYGTAVTRAANQNFPAGATMTYAAVGTLPTGISINANTGAVTVGANAAAQNQTTYTVRATATGNFSGTKDAQVRITVTAKSISSINFTYDDVIILYLFSASKSPKGIPAGASMSYAVVGDALPTGVTLNTSTGRINVANNTAAQAAKTYTIRATATGNYTGTKDGTVSIQVNQQSINLFSFSYTDNTSTYGTADTISPNENFLAEVNRTYTAVSTLPAGVSINANTGVITVGANAAVQALIGYQIRVTLTGNFTGSKQTTVRIKINPLNISGLAAVAGYGTNNHIVTYGSTEVIDPVIGTVPEASLSFAAVSTLPTGITLNTGNGDITVGSTAGVKARTTYVIRATGSGNYTGTKDLPVDITVVAANITSYTFNYVDINTEHTTAVTRNPNQNFPAGVTMSYAVVGTALPTGISINANTGAITVGANAAAQNQTTYTVRATATGNFTGTKDAQIKITVTTKSISGMNPTYDDINTLFASARTRSPKGIPAGTTVQYAAVSTLPTGVTLNTTTGVVSVGTNVVVQAATTYTIRITGIGSYTGTKDATVRITVNPETISKNTFTYADTTAMYDLAKTITPNHNFSTEANITYSVFGMGLPNGITLNTSTGEITIGRTAAVQSQKTYTIRATSTGNYNGTKDATVRITVDPRDLGTLTNAFIYNRPSVIPHREGRVIVLTLFEKIPLASLRFSEVTPLPSGMVLGTTTGNITVNDTTAASARTTYFIRVTVITTGNYTGTIDVPVEIQVEADSIAPFSFRYTDIQEKQGTTIGRTPTHNFPTAANITYVLVGSTSLPQGIVLDAATGIITVTNAAQTQARTEYTIRATSTGTFTGSNDAPLRITIDP